MYQIKARFFHLMGKEDQYLDIKHSTLLTNIVRFMSRLSISFIFQFI